MTESKQAVVASKDALQAARDNEEAERSLGRMVAVGLPVLGLVGAGVVGVVAGIGSALLVVAATALLGTISLLWASVRTLSGDAPLSSEIESVVVRRIGVDVLDEQKRRALRALKDLETEHSLGKIDDADYQELVARYRNEAKSVLREMDLQVAPMRDEAEKLARAFLVKRGLREAEPEAAREAEQERESDRPAKTKRVKCGKCTASNEPDAAFCKKCGTALERAAEASDADA